MVASPHPCLTIGILSQVQEPHKYKLTKTGKLVTMEKVERVEKQRKSRKDSKRENLSLYLLP